VTLKEGAAKGIRTLDGNPRFLMPLGTGHNISRYFIIKKR
jgi:hypothetical protein